MQMAARRIRFQNRLRERSLRRARVFQERVNPLEKYSSIKLHRRFRFTDFGIEYLFDLLRGTLQNETFRSFAVPPLLKLLVTLRFLACGGFQILLGDSVGLSQSAVSGFLWKVIEAICRLAPRFIVYPTDAQSRNRNKTRFFEIAGIPGVTSLIDCTHVRIISPSANEDVYVNRKGYHSINVQATMDSDFKYTSVVAKYPGSMHDSAILQETALYHSHETNAVTGMLLGDSGYHCTRWLITPYPNPVPGSAEERFNRYYNTVK